MTWQATIKPYKHQITHLGRVDVVIFAENFFFCCENSGVKRGKNPTGGPRPYLPRALRLLDRHVFNVVEQCLTTALFTARADGGSASPAQQDFCKACLWQVIDASIDLRDPNPN